MNSPADRSAGDPARSVDLFVLVSGSRYHGVRRSGRGLADALSLDSRVLFVDPPASFLTSRGAGMPGPGTDRGELAEEAPNLIRLSPTAPPGKDRVAMQSVTRWSMARQIRAAIRQLGGSRIVLIQQSAHRSVIGRVGETASVYHATDDLSAGSDLLGLDGGRLSKAQLGCVRAADLTVAVSRTLTEKWSAVGHRVRYLPNGVDLDAFVDTPAATPATDVTLERPIAGVVGTLSERLDMDVLQAVATRMSLLLIGPESFRIDRDRFTELIAMPSVQWVGGQPFESLAGYYRHIDVGLVPYTLSTFNRASFPLKSIEYLAAGKPVVATPLDSVIDLKAPCTTITGDVAEFVAAATEAAAGLDEDDRQVVAEFVSHQGWNDRADRLRGYLEEVL